MVIGSPSNAASSGSPGAIGELVISALPDAMVVLSSELNILRSNDQFRVLFGLPIYSAHPGASILDVADQIDFNVSGLDDAQPRFPLRARWERIFTEADPMDHVEMLGDGRSFSVRCRPLIGTGTLVLFADMSAAARRDADFSALARRNDELSAELSEVTLGLTRALDSPLRKISDCAEKLGDKHSTSLNEGGRIYIDRVVETSARMRGVLRDFMSYVRLTKASELNENVSMEDIVRRVLEAMRAEISKAGANVEYSALPAIPGDPDLLFQVFRHLIDNALKYRRTDVQPLVKISCETQFGKAGQPEAKFLIADNGSGFDPRHADAVFGMFLSVGGDMDAPRNGFGLAACRNIARQHRGSISAETEIGKGTTISLVLPAKHQKLGSSEAQDDEALLGIADAR